MDIDTTGFELGMPTREEILEHQSQLLTSEIERLHQELSQAKANIAKLVEINQDLNRRVGAEFKRANEAHILLVQTQNRLRCIHGIDASGWFAD